MKAAAALALVTPETSYLHNDRIPFGVRTAGLVQMSGRSKQLRCECVSVAELEAELSRFPAPRLTRASSFELA